MRLQHIGSNQTQVEIGESTILFSYNTPVAANKGGKFYRTAERHSVTTSKHINAWLHGVEAETMPQSWFDTLAS